MTTATAVQRQQLLFLYLSHPNPTSETIAWSLFDGAGREDRQAGDAEKPPYPSVVAAMRDGWRVIQVAQQLPPQPGMEHRTSYLPYEFVLERMVEVCHE
jgi:hypothetical protein